MKYYWKMIIKLKAIIALILGRPVMYKVTVENGTVSAHPRTGGVFFDCVFDRSDISGLQPAMERALDRIAEGVTAE